MTYNPNIDSGYNELKSWVQVPSAVFTSIPQSSELDQAQYPERTARNYAQMVYQVNSLPVSGVVSVDAVGINGDGDVALSGDQLKVFDGETLSKLTQIETKLDNVQVKRYSKIVKTQGNYTYVMDAPVGSGAPTVSSDAIWRIQRVYDDGTTVVVDWADGDENFDNIAANYLSLNYEF